MKLAAAAGLVALLVGAAVLAFQPFSSSPPGSSPERTVYSAVYALKHKNFGRFCSYLEQKYRGSPAECAAGNASGWGMNVMMFGVDIFDKDSHVVAGSRVDVNATTVKYKVKFSAIPKPYVFTVKRQASGNWRVTAIKQAA